MKGREIFKVDGDKITRLRRHCPKCGDGFFLADHKDRLSCGKCGYTEFKKSEKKPLKTDNQIKPEGEKENSKEK